MSKMASNRAISHNAHDYRRYWYALYTRSRYEKKIDRQLKEKKIECYLPLQKVLRQWSDRRKWVEEPLFRCYIFIRTNMKERLKALQTEGVVKVVSFNGKPAIVRDEEIENIQRILKEAPAVEVCSTYKVGDKVKIVRGPLAGICGILEEVQGQRRLIVRIDSIRQALCFNIDKLDAEIIQ